MKALSLLLLAALAPWAAAEPQAADKAGTRTVPGTRKAAVPAAKARGEPAREWSVSVYVDGVDAAKGLVTFRMFDRDKKKWGSPATYPVKPGAAIVHTGGGGELVELAFLCEAPRCTGPFPKNRLQVMAKFETLESKTWVTGMRIFGYPVSEQPTKGGGAPAKVIERAPVYK